MTQSTFISVISSARGKFLEKLNHLNDTEKHGEQLIMQGFFLQLHYCKIFIDFFCYVSSTAGLIWFCVTKQPRKELAIFSVNPLALHRGKSKDYLGVAQKHGETDLSP